MLEVAYPLINALFDELLEWGWYVSHYTYRLPYLTNQNDQKHQKWPYNVTNILGKCFCVFQVQTDWKQGKSEQNGAWMGIGAKWSITGSTRHIFDESWRKFKKSRSKSIPRMWRGGRHGKPKQNPNHFSTLNPTPKFPSYPLPRNLNAKSFSIQNSKPFFLHSLVKEV